MGLVTGFLFFGIFVGYCCFKFALLPNFIGLCLFAVWQNESKLQCLRDNKKRLYILGAAYGLTIYLVSFSILLVTDALKRNADLIQDLHKLNVSIILILFPAAFLSGIFAIRLFIRMLQSAGQNLPSIRV